MNVSPHAVGQAARPFIAPPGPTAKPVGVPEAPTSKPGTPITPVAKTPPPMAAPKVHISTPGLTRGEKPSLTAAPPDPPAVKLSPHAIKVMAAAVSKDAINEHAKPYIDVVSRHITQQIHQARDKEADGSFTIDELGINKQRFDRIDNDSDGLVSSVELFDALKNRLENAFKRRPDVNLKAFVNRALKSFGVGNNAKIAMADLPPTAQGFGKADINGDGILTAREMQDDLDAKMPQIDRRQHLDKLAQALQTHLDESGYTDKPPANVRALVNALHLDPQSSSFIFDALTARYPHGLGISLLG